MLKSLEIKNYILIHQLTIFPTEGLNIITGETGTGKSILLGALGLLSGKRADYKSLLDISKKCIVEAVFDISKYDLENIFEELNIDFEEKIIVRREISANSKSRAFINDTIVNLDILRKFVSRLMDIHSQNQTFQLANFAFQRTLVDVYAKNQDLLKIYQEAYKYYKQSEKMYQDLLEDQYKRKKSYDFDFFLLKELEQADLDNFNLQASENELQKLENVENIKSNLNVALNYLSKSEFCTESSLKSTIDALKQISKYSNDYEILKNRLESSLIELIDISYEIENQENNLSFDKERIIVVQDKLDRLYLLQRKHKTNSIKELLRIRENLRENVNKVVNFDKKLQKLKNDKEKSYKYLLNLAEQLSKNRQSAIPSLEEEIKKLLADVGIPSTKLIFQVNEISPDKYGKDHITLLFSANKNLRAHKLKHVASGGEFSRLMLVTKYILARCMQLPTMIFDEIDMGISGQTAIKVGKILKDIAKNHQLIIITHTPQIAAKAQTHFLVYKKESSNKTLSYIRKLKDNERANAIAEMIGGKESSDSAYKSARELMK